MYSIHESLSTSATCIPPTHSGLKPPLPYQKKACMFLPPHATNHPCQLHLPIWQNTWHGTQLQSSSTSYSSKFFLFSPWVVQLCTACCIHANCLDFSVKVPIFYCLPRLHASYLLFHEFSTRLAERCPGASGLRSQLVVPRGAGGLSRSPLIIAAPPLYTHLLYAILMSLFLYKITLFLT